MKNLIVIFLVLLAAKGFGQKTGDVFIRLQEPLKENNSVHSSRQFIVGATCKDCSLTINGQPVKVYPTGSFAFELALRPGDTLINMVAMSGNGKSGTKRLSYAYTLPAPPDTVKTLEIASIETLPEGNLYVRPGDVVKIKVKALPGSTVTAWNKLTLSEIPTSKGNTMPGIYQGEYTVKESDSFLVSKIPITLTDKNGRSVTKESKYWLSNFGPLAPDIAVTKGRLAHLLFGLGDDRLGGAKIGYLDSMVRLKIVGKVGSKYKVQLTKYKTAYIDDDLVEFLPKGYFTPESLTDTWRVYGDSLYDYVTVGLSVRLPYQSNSATDPSRITVDVFGATNNTNWITQLESVQEIKSVNYEQVEDGIFRINIELKHKQQWGYKVYYNNNNLVIKIKHQPRSLNLKDLVIAVDAGHGGSNTGAGGPTGVAEKDLTLAVALKLQRSLQQLGARVIMTRTTEKFVDNKERILFYRDSMPDLLISLHLNSSGDPIRVGGTSTYYRYPMFRNLSLDIYKRMLELGLKEYGNTGSFNFMLNSPIEYPNALVEMLFLSNPEEEMKILDEGFQQQIVDKIISGIKDFLNDAK